MSPSNRPELTGRESRDQALFERVAADYHRKDLLPAHRRARRHRLMQTLRSVELPADCSILEVGCGAGFAADYLIPNCDEQDSWQFVVRAIATQAFLA